MVPELVPVNGNYDDSWKFVMMYNDVGNSLRRIGVVTYLVLNARVMEIG